MLKKNAKIIGYKKYKNYFRFFLDKYQEVTHVSTSSFQGLLKI